MPDNNILQTICEKRMESVLHAMQATPIEAARKMAEMQCGNQRSFLNNITQAKGPALITEIKSASPSQGDIRTDAFNPSDLAQELEGAGAHCLSVLTEPDWFKGGNDHLIQARQACALPVLRKDFIVHEWQIYETAAIGADALLLIVAALDNEQLQSYHDLGREMGLDILVEVHDMEELERAARIKNLSLLGINNRNLKTLEIDTGISEQLARYIPQHITTISESGIHDPQTLFTLHHRGYKGFLIGHALMQDTSPSRALKRLIGQENT